MGYWVIAPETAPKWLGKCSVAAFSTGFWPVPSDFNATCPRETKLAAHEHHSMRRVIPSTPATISAVKSSAGAVPRWIIAVSRSSYEHIVISMRPEYFYEYSISCSFRKRWEKSTVICQPTHNQSRRERHGRVGPFKPSVFLQMAVLWIKNVHFFDWNARNILLNMWFMMLFQDNWRIIQIRGVKKANMAVWQKNPEQTTKNPAHVRVLESHLLER